MAAVPFPSGLEAGMRVDDRAEDRGRRSQGTPERRRWDSPTDRHGGGHSDRGAGGGTRLSGMRRPRPEEFDGPRGKRRRMDAEEQEIQVSGSGDPGRFCHSRDSRPQRLAHPYIIATALDTPISLLYFA